MSAVPIDWNDSPLVPAVVQDSGTLQVLMLGFMNREAYERTRATGRVHFFSRSRQALWRKGETSGNELIVEDVLINCEENSLLLLVAPQGPTCHEGYQSCFYRRVERSGALTYVLDRLEDPGSIYGDRRTGDDPTRIWYRAYEYLRDHDLTAVSGTSRRLRDPGEPLAARLADELIELAGVLDGSHSHHGLVGDTILEGSQTSYWTILIAVRAGVTWNELRPDRAFQTGDSASSREEFAIALRHEAERWRTVPPDPTTIPGRCHATLSLIAHACRSAGVESSAILQRDLDDLRSRDYLAPVFDPL